MIIKSVGIVVIAVMSGLLLRSFLPWLPPLISFSAGLLILIICLEGLDDTFAYYYGICIENDFGDYFKIMLKGLGVAYLAGVGADLCRDCGEGRLAGRIEFAAKAEILIIAFPFVKSLIELSESILLL